MKFSEKDLQDNGVSFIQGAANLAKENGISNEAAELQHTEAGNEIMDIVNDGISKGKSALEIIEEIDKIFNDKLKNIPSNTRAVIEQIIKQKTSDLPSILKEVEAIDAEISSLREEDGSINKKEDIEKFKELRTKKLQLLDDAGVNNNTHLKEVISEQSLKEQPTSEQGILSSFASYTGDIPYKLIEDKVNSKSDNLTGDPQKIAEVLQSKGIKVTDVPKGEGVGVGGDVESTTKALEEVGKNNGTIFDKLKQLINRKNGKQDKTNTRTDGVGSTHQTREEFSRNFSDYGNELSTGDATTTTDNQIQKIKSGEFLLSHGSNTDFEFFDKSKQGKGLGNQGGGIFFYDSSQKAEKLSQKVAKEKGGSQHIYQVKVDGDNYLRTTKKPTQEQLYQIGKVNGIDFSKSNFENGTDLYDAIAKSFGDWNEKGISDDEIVKRYTESQNKASEHLASKGITGDISEFDNYQNEYNIFDSKNISIKERIKIHNSDAELIADQYHKAKADGSNPELVKAVEQSIKETPKGETERIKPKSKFIETTSDYRTADVGNHEGQQEFETIPQDGSKIDKSKGNQTELKKQQTENILNGNVRLDADANGEGGKGETGKPQHQSTLQTFDYY